MKKKEIIYCDKETWYWHKNGCTKCKKTHRKEVKYYDYENPCEDFISLEK
jgi:ABC-type enterochelin transport system substrate-binding protein